MQCCMLLLFSGALQSFAQQQQHQQQPQPQVSSPHREEIKHRVRTGATFTLANIAAHHTAERPESERATDWIYTIQNNNDVSCPREPLDASSSTDNHEHHHHQQRPCIEALTMVNQSTFYDQNLSTPHVER